MLIRTAPVGYPQLAALIESDGNFMLFRRFGFLHGRLLLQVQDCARALDEQVDRGSLDQEQSIEMNQTGKWYARRGSICIN
jgi:hypothetical protein